MKNDASAPPSLDALELHFLEMGKHPLLTPEQEIDLARKLERADLAFTRTLVASPDGRRVLADVAAALRDGETRPEDVERNPGEGLLGRLQALVTSARPRSPNLRLHPRTVTLIERTLSEQLSRTPTAALRRLLAELAAHREDADRATAAIVQANFRIVVTFARRYRGMPLVDLVQEGNLGLLRAVDKFDHRRGLRFSTYAAWWIRHALGRALADQSKMIRLPVHLTGTVQRVRRASDRMARETGREPTPEELAARTGIALDQIRRALDVVPQPISLDVPATEGVELSDVVADPKVVPADEVLAAGERRAEAHALLATLPAREAEILRLRYGVDGGTSRTLEEVGARLSLSRERARQLERDALRKLRAASEKRRAAPARPMPPENA